MIKDYYVSAAPSDYGSPLNESDLFDASTMPSDLSGLGSASGWMIKLTDFSADASAEGLELVAEAINAPGGRSAVKMQLVEDFVDQYGEILEKADVSVVPGRR